MALADLTSRDAVLKALEEYDRIGQQQFLKKYDFGKARSYFIVHEGRSYDSKAIVGAAHGYQFLDRGPLRAADFSGGDATVKPVLESLGFTVAMTEPRIGDLKPLTLFSDYARRDVHDIFSPHSDFVAGAGLWGLSGIVEYEPQELVFFVTFGREQGEHRFDEGITTDGVVTWQSQPGQTLADPQVQRLIAHDAERHNIRLFLRTRDKAPGGRPMPYTYLGRLSYLTHDTQRERPVYFQWQLIDQWPPPNEVLTRVGLTLEVNVAETTPAPHVQPGLLQVPTPARTRRQGTATRQFRGRRSPDRAKQDAANRALGMAGELAVVEHERQRLTNVGHHELAVAVRHVALVEGDGAGYDVESFELDGSSIHIEAKTTRGEADTDFFVSLNEVEFSKQHSESYRLYRLFNFDAEKGAGSFYVIRGSLVEQANLTLEPTLFTVRLGAAVPDSAVL